MTLRASALQNNLSSSASQQRVALINAEVQTFDRVAIGLYAAGGAALLTSIILWFVPEAPTFTADSQNLNVVGRF